MESKKSTRKTGRGQKKNTACQFKGRASKTDEEKEEDKKINTANKSKRRASKTDEEKDQDKRKDTVSKSSRRASKTPSQKDEDKRKDTASKSSRRASKTPSQKYEDKRKDTASKSSRRSSKTPCQKNEDKRKDTASKSSRRSSKTPCQKNEDKRKETASKSSRRSSKTPLQKDEDKRKETASKSSRRSSRTPAMKQHQKGISVKYQQQSRKLQKEKQTSLEYISKKFQKNISEGPVCVCVCCKRLLYRHSVVCYARTRYFKNDAEVINTYIDHDYHGPDGRQWVCKTCDRSLKNNTMPAQAEANCLTVEEMPDTLRDLNPLEVRLISQRLPFMQIVNLPRGGQKGIKGAVVNVPSQVGSVVETLPRLPSECGLVPVKLKKKLQYKGHSMYQSIRPRAMMEGLRELKKQNPLYKDFDIDDEWMERARCEDGELCQALFEDSMSDNSSSDEETDTDIPKPIKQKNRRRYNSKEDSQHGDKLPLSEDDDTCMKGTETDKLSTPSSENKNTDEKNTDKDEESEEEKEKLRGLPFNTCLQPSGVQNTHGASVYSLAPGQDQVPLSMLTDKQCDILSFPNLFPSGKFGLHDNRRKVAISSRRYFNQRLLNVDSRFASNTEYLFFAQYLTEVEQITNNISIALRKGKSEGALNAGRLNNPEKVQDLLNYNEAYHFLNTVRGSQPYWEKTLLDLFAMVKQLGIPTWFCTFSAADLRWPEAIRIIAQQHGHKYTDEEVFEMDWQQRCRWLRTNPVTAARHFEHRSSCLLKDVLKSSLHPVGKITDHFIRIEFQQRGSPHLHCVLWIEGAPKLEETSEEEVCDFINQYVSGTLPDPEDELYELVSTLQRHSHSATCRKTGKQCRFSFPKPPSSQTLIAHAPTLDDIDPARFMQQKKENIAVLGAVHKTMKDTPDLSYEQLLRAADVTPELYQRALKESSVQPSVILKREPSDVNINNYNSTLLSIWKANIDIQFITNPWACAMYVLSYISKSERNMGQLLKEASKESSSDDSIRKQMKRLGNVFLTHREVSQQESSYRVLSMALKLSSRVVIFLNTSPPPDRVRILKAMKDLALLPQESKAIFLTNILDRYAARPDSMEDICLAVFASGYRLLGQKDGEKEYDEEDDEDIDYHNAANPPKRKVYELKNGLGVTVERKRRAILRSPKFSKLKQPEKYFRSLLMRYLPWREEEKDLISDYASFEDHFQAVKDHISDLLTLFESDDGILDEALKEVLADSEQLQHAWDLLASTTEQIAQEERDEGTSVAEEFGNLDPAELKDFKALPEFASSSAFTVEVDKNQLSPEDYCSLIQSLNEQQRDIFDIILQWCRQTLQSRKTLKPPDPFRIFLTGGAGTGKSHLVKAVYHMARKELRALCDSDDQLPIILMAPTGVAAANIGGLTIHHIFSIYEKNHQPGSYHSLSADKLAIMRNIFQNLKIVIIDEVSMVGHNILYTVHRRLQEIAGTIAPDIYFGGVSILAVGDFYQLAPVLKTPVFGLPSDAYAKLNPVHLWKDLFHIAELTEVMRQKGDAEFCHLLNRVRTAAVTKEDVETLESRIVSPDSPSYPLAALHVFPTNAQVNNHNERILYHMGQPILTICAQDSRKDTETGKINLSVFNAKADAEGLMKTLKLAKGPRVMLTKNVDVADGLVNGAQGVVVDFLQSSVDSGPYAVVIKFDNRDAGKKQKEKFKTSPVPPDCTPIFQDEVRYSAGKYNAASVKRKQFPLRLSFACTIHKVQGLTVDSIVVSFDGNFFPGQAYVALSRATTLQGLHLLNFTEHKITCSEDVSLEMVRLRTEMPLLFHNAYRNIPSPSFFKLLHLNSRSLSLHRKDVASHAAILASDVLCVSETWLSEQHSSKDFMIDGFKLHRRDRYKCYAQHCDHNESLAKCSTCNNKGGVAVFVRNELQSSLFDCTKCSVPNNEFICINVIHPVPGQLNVVSVYRPQHVPMKSIMMTLTSLQDILPSNSQTIVCGDFNLDLLQQDSLFEASMSSQYMQLIHTPTHVSGSLLDHIYIQNPKALGGTVPLYYSDHDAVYVAIPTPGETVQPVKLCSEVSQEEMDRTEKIMQKKQERARNVDPHVASKTHHTRLLQKAKLSSLSKDKDERNCSSSDPSIVRYDPACISVDQLLTPSKLDKETVARQLHVKCKTDAPVDPTRLNAQYAQHLQTLQTQSPNCSIDYIVGDGNCFFRAVSKEIFGTEKYHKKLRQAICTFMKNHQNTFMNWVEGGLQAFDDHVQKMERNGQWATMVELIATATFFNSTIMEFTHEYTQTDWRWIQILPVDIHPDDPQEGRLPLQGCLYLHHTMGIHYDRIVPRLQVPVI